MKKALAFLAGGLAVGLTLARIFRRRRRRAEESAPTPPPEDADPRAAALRAQLADVRQSAPDESAQAAAPAEDDVDEARRRVHERGRAAVDAMKDESRNET